MKKVIFVMVFAVFGTFAFANEGLKKKEESCVKEAPQLLMNFENKVVTFETKTVGDFCSTVQRATVLQMLEDGEDIGTALRVAYKVGRACRRAMNAL